MRLPKARPNFSTIYEILEYEEHATTNFGILNSPREYELNNDYATLSGGPYGKLNSTYDPMISPDNITHSMTIIGDIELSDM